MDDLRERLAIALALAIPKNVPVDCVDLAETVIEALGLPPSGAELIAAERARQIVGEGWTPDHDREHPSGVLAAAGACYIRTAVIQLTGGTDELTVPPDGWPFDPGWWKPKDPLRNLVRGAALAAAEIDRHQQP